MPQVFKIGSYWVYFWSNENDPLEPIHAHVSEGSPTENATKIWITQAGKCYLCNNNSKIPMHTLKKYYAKQEAKKLFKSGIHILEKYNTIVRFP